MLYKSGAETILSSGPFMRLLKVKNALCEDGRRRTAVCTSTADTYFSIPAYVRVHGKTVTGFLTTATAKDPYDDPDWHFVANSYGKNGDLLKGEKV